MKFDNSMTDPKLCVTFADASIFDFQMKIFESLNIIEN